MVQGIIDLYFSDEDNKLVLVDYKTDNILSGEELINRYTVQLKYYKKALEEILHTNVYKTFIYSFKLNKEIEIDFT